MKRRIIACLVAVVSVLGSFWALAGCGGKDKISIYVYGQTHELAIYETLINKFTEETGIEVERELVASDGYADRLVASLGTKNCPDVFYAEPGAIASYANNGLVAELDDLLEAEKAGGGFDYTDYIDGVLDYYKYDVDTHARGTGKTYAVPKDVSAYPMCYNKVVVDKAIAAGRWPADLPKPWEMTDENGDPVAYTWDQFEKACEACSFSEGGNKYFGTGLIDTFAMHSWVWTGGGDYLSEDKKTVTVNETKFTTSLQRFFDLMDQKNVSPNRLEMSENGYYNRWLAGEIAFFNCGVWDVGAFEGVAKSTLDYYLMPAPRKDEGSEWYSYIGTLGYAVSSRSKAPGDALKLAMYMGLSDESYERMSRRTVIQLPNSKKKVEAFLSDKTVKAPSNRKLFYDVVSGGHGRTYPTAFTYDATWYNKFIDGLSDCWKADDNSQPKKTIADYCASVQSAMQSELDRGLSNEQQGL